jgi:hypothetical protein
MEEVHTPVVVLQHAPTGQGLGVQEAAPLKVLPLAHAAEKTIEQAPEVLLQHAPVPAQAAEHVPVLVHVPVHAVWRTMLHAPVEELQQRPAPGHGEGEQTDPWPW